MKNRQKIVNKKGTMQYGKNVLLTSLGNVILNIQLKFQVNPLKFF